MANSLWHRLRRAAVGGAVVLVAVPVVLLAGPPRVPPDGAERTDEATDLCRQSEAAGQVADFHKALTLADRAVQAAPSYAPGYARRGRAKFFLGDEEGALADCDQAVRRDPALAAAYAYRAPVAGLRGGPAAGVADADKALRLDPHLPGRAACAALARLNAGDLAGAEQEAKAATAEATDAAEGHRVRGLVLLARGDAHAQAEFDDAVRLSGGRPFYRAARADCLIELAQADGVEADRLALDRAQDDIDEALKADPACAPAHLAAARLAAIRERRTDVLAACEKAVAANPRLVEAYLRAADDLSPKDRAHFEMLQTALAHPLDLREFKGGDFAFGALLADLQRLASDRVKRDVTIYINYHSFDDDQRQTLREAKINLHSLMDASGENLLKDVTFRTILDTLCAQAGAAYFVGPEYIEIVSRKTAQAEAGRKAHAVSHELIGPAELYRQEARVLRFEQALRQTIDLRELKGGDFALAALLTDVQRLASNAMRADVPIYIEFNSFPVETRTTLRDAKVNLSGLMDASGENLLKEVKVGTVLDIIVRNVGEEAKVRVTPDYLAVVWTGKADEGEASWRPLRLTGKPPAEAIDWLNRGIKAVPESARLYRARGQVHLEQFQLDAAIADLTRALERNPADKAAYRLRSLAYAARGQPGDEALARADALATKP
jgi:tetratricopeptide (TPR) repeat protein